MTYVSRHFIDKQSDTQSTCWRTYSRLSREMESFRHPNTAFSHSKRVISNINVTEASESKAQDIIHMAAMPFGHTD